MTGPNYAVVEMLVPEMLKHEQLRLDKSAALKGGRREKRMRENETQTGLGKKKKAFQGFVIKQTRCLVHCEQMAVMALLTCLNIIRF